MNVSNYKNSQTFTSGLNSKIVFQEKLAKTKSLEKYFAKQEGIETQFLQNKSFALAAKLCLNIFENLFKKSLFI